MDRESYSEKWQERFNFFDEYGSPYTPRARESLKKSKLGLRVMININFIAFFFGFIYFFVLGLWRKNLVLFAICIAVGITITIIENISGIVITQAVESGINCGFCYIWAITANYAYYLKEVKGSKSWNPFEGLSGK